MKAWKIATSLIIAGGILLTGCAAEKSPNTESDNVSQNESEIAVTDFIAATKSLVEGLAIEGGDVNWDEATSTYNDTIKPIVQSRDTEYSEQVNDQLEAAMNAGKDGSLSVAVVIQLHEKLLQKVALLNVRHHFKEANDKFSSSSLVH